ncbi:DUF1800 family protein [Puteibacter caeruleilacunae]|nr:DUF1800 family protein [Puteibacter caeruleilacunae]
MVKQKEDIKYQAARLLNMASMGANYQTISEVAQTGIHQWIDNQFELPARENFTKKTWQIWEHFSPQYIQLFGRDYIVNHGDAVIPYWYYWKMAWWDTILKSEEHLRQRITYALSQILVISEHSNLQLSGPGMANFYDVLYRNAFGNFREILYEVALHPMMGFYLSHINNPKSNHAKNIHPDENFAREIMQLFSIGLIELNTDGSPKCDSQGKPIPTYDNNDIKEFAKIFTGLGPAGYYWPWEDYSHYPSEWANEYNTSPATVITWKPMIPFEQWHEPGSKKLLRDKVVPAGQSTLKDINDAIDNLFHHPNVGPFIGRLLIQRLTTSNPSGDYIKRVALKFNDNGQGVRGDMKAVIKAILTDEEILNANTNSKESTRKLKEPLLRYTQALRAFNARNMSGKLWNWGYQFDEAVSQGVLASPSVFNFYLPDYQPNGPIAAADLYAPEYQIHTSATAINYINLVHEWFINDNYGEVATKVGKSSHNAPSYEDDDLDPNDYIYLDFQEEIVIAHDASRLIERLNLILTGGEFSMQTKASIIKTIEKERDPEKRVKLALFLSFICPDYCVT